MAMTDEKMITALALCGSVSATAVQLGIAESTIYRRLQDNEFRAKLEIVKGDILREFKASYLESSERARAAIESMMENDKINPAIRLQACQTIINTAVKFVELSERAEDRALRAKEYERNTALTSGTIKLIRFSILGKIFPNSSRGAFLGSQSASIFHMGRNTGKAIEHRQRGNKCHIGAFWSIGRGRTAKK